MTDANRKMTAGSLVGEVCNHFKSGLVWFCGGLSTFHSLRELLSGFVSTNTTQILLACKQMEFDNKY